MKIVFPTNKAEWDALLDDRFGRAPGFVVYNDEDESLTFIENEYKDAGHGVGIQAGQTIVQAGASVVITSGPFGPKASEILQTAGVKMISDAGKITLKEALAKVKES